MQGTVQTRYTDEQITTWLRGLLTIAWADGHYDPDEKAAIEQIARDKVIPCIELPNLEVISATELAVQFNTPDAAENFMRTAVIVALADGVLSTSELKQLRSFQTALGVEAGILDTLEATVCDLEADELQRDAGELPSSEKIIPTDSPSPKTISPQSGIASVDGFPKDNHAALLSPVKHWLDDMEIHDPHLARFICKMVPAQCPFERDVKLFGKKVVHIPPMCKINPLYDQLVGLRFRSLSYLADDCGEDISEYC